MQQAGVNAAGAGRSEKAERNHSDEKACSSSSETERATESSKHNGEGYSSSTDSSSSGSSKREKSSDSRTSCTISGATCSNRSNCAESSAAGAAEQHRSNTGAGEYSCMLELQQRRHLQQ